MTHDELLAKVTAENEGTRTRPVLALNALRAVVEYAKELSQKDYRGNPPVEHYIAKELYAIIEKELG